MKNFIKRLFWRIFHKQIIAHCYESSAKYESELPITSKDIGRCNIQGKYTFTEKRI